MLSILDSSIIIDGIKGKDSRVLLPKARFVLTHHRKRQGSRSGFRSIQARWRRREPLMYYSRLRLVYLRIESNRRPHLLPLNIPHQLPLRVLLLERDRSGLGSQGEEFAGGATFESERDEEADGVSAYIAEKGL
jgi:hypothetical protein